MLLQLEKVDAIALPAWCSAIRAVPLPVLWPVTAQVAGADLPHLLLPLDMGFQIRPERAELIFMQGIIHEHDFMLAIAMAEQIARVGRLRRQPPYSGNRSQGILQGNGQGKVLPQELP